MAAGQEHSALRRRDMEDKRWFWGKHFVWGLAYSAVVPLLSLVIFFANDRRVNNFYDRLCAALACAVWGLGLGWPCAGWATAALGVQLAVAMMVARRWFRARKLGSFVSGYALGAVCMGGLSLFVYATAVSLLYWNAPN